MSISQKNCMMQVSKLILVNCITKERTAENLSFNRILVPHIKTNYQLQEENGLKKVFDDNEYYLFSNVLQENGMWQDAEYLQSQIGKMRTKKSAKNASTLASMNDLALTYSQQGKYNEAKVLQLKVMDLHKMMLGPEHPYTLISMNNLVVTYSREGKY